MKGKIVQREIHDALEKAAWSGCRTLEELKESIKMYEGKGMLRWVKEHPVTAMETLNNIIKA